ncbi:DegT/DnrJ/EryC1/StrS family aminotransferase [Shigella flexneri]
MHWATIGHIGCLSFHETKDHTAGGEGARRLINDKALIERAEIIREKGTNRSQFFRGQVEYRPWRDIGSSYLMIHSCKLRTCGRNWKKQRIVSRITSAPRHVMTMR